MPVDEHDASRSDRLTATWVELAIRLGILAFLLYWSFVLVRPFITIAIWSIVITVALYPVYEWMVGWFYGRRRLAAMLITILTLLIVIGPATWLVLGLIDSLRTLSEHISPAVLSLPPPSETVKSWPLIGVRVYEFWQLASDNLSAALGRVVPHLKPVGGALLGVAAEAGTGTIKFVIAIVVAGFLYAPAPAIGQSIRMFARRVAPGRGEGFVDLARDTIRTVSRGVIGISALQAFLTGIGLMVAGVPAASMITSAVLVLGIMQIGPSFVILPLIAWSWWTMETTTALLFTAYMVPVNLLDNILRPFVMGRGLPTPMLIILIGVIGGTLSHGITGLFLGPIILAVIWELLVAWVKDSEDVPATGTPAKTD